jgi:hypothetical protein
MRPPQEDIVQLSRLCFAAVLGSGLLSAQDSLSRLKALQDDGIGSSALAAINACQPLAPSPFGSFIPANVVVPVPATTTSTGAISFVGPFPITVPAMTILVPANTVTIPGTAFLPPAPRLCPVSTSGDAGGSPPQPPGKSSFNMSLVIDFSTYRSNGSGGGCSLASGRLTLDKQDQGNATDAVTIDHAGLLCDTAGIGSAKTYTVTYNITGGTRKYVGCRGLGV